MKLSKLLRFFRRLYLLISSLRIESYRSLLFLPCNSNFSVLDLGANIGQSASVFWIRGIECHCFEPDPRAFKVLSQLFKDVSFIHTYNLAVVSDSDYTANRKLPFFLHQDAHKRNSRLDYTQASSLMVDKVNVNDSEPIYVDCIKFSDVANIAPQFSLLKCDIEGYEYHLFPDVARNLSKFDLIFMETHVSKNSHWKSKHDELLQCIRDSDSSGFWNIHWH